MEPIKISLPRSWNDLTVLQLEYVSKILIETARKFTETGSYNQNELLTKAFFYLSGLRIASIAMTDEHDEELLERSFRESEDDSEVYNNKSEMIDYYFATVDTDPNNIYYNCEFADEVIRSERQMQDGDIIPIRIYLNEILSMTVGNITQKDVDSYFKKMERYNKAIESGKEVVPPEAPNPKGPLAWMLSQSTRTIFPYPELELNDEYSKEPHKFERCLDEQTLTQTTRRYPEKVTMQGPAELMQDFSWRQYRFASDIRSYLAQCENTLYDMKKKKSSKQSIEKQEVLISELRSQFLATIFSRPILHTNKDTNQLEYSPIFVPSQSTDNAYLFMSFPEEKFQAIDFWWQGMMAHLQQQYPKVFRREQVKTIVPKNDDPLTLYTRSTTTMIKYAATNEEEVNSTTYTIILQHINDMADENDRIKEMKK